MPKILEQVNMTKNKNTHGVVPLIDRLKMIENRMGLPHSNAESLTKILPLLIPGWDSTSNTLMVDPPSGGVWRAPHPKGMENLNLQKAGIYPFAALGMSKAEMMSRMFRNLRICPHQYQWCQEAVHTAQHADPFDPYAKPKPQEGNAICQIKAHLIADERKVRSRNCYFITLIGHTVEDVVDFLIHLGKDNPKLATLIMRKDFMTALEEFPNCLDLPWPNTCLARFKYEIRRDYLPPFLVLVLFAELARHAQGQAAHNRLSFDKHGHYVNLAPVRKDIKNAKSGNSLPATKHLLQCKWMQTSALLAPFSIVASQNPMAAINWSKDSRDKIFDFTVRAGNAGIEVLNDALSPVFAPDPGEEVMVAIRDFTSHPNAALINRSNGTVTFVNRPAITFYGMTWSESASVALTLIAEQARSWNKEYRPRNRIPQRMRDRSPSISEAIAVLTYCWLESSAPAAFKGTYGRPAKRKGVAADGWNSIGPEDIAWGPESGKDLLSMARRLIALLPAEGKPGYSAFARASLWIDRQHDDYSHYETMAKKSLSDIKVSNANHAHRAEYGGRPRNIVVNLSTGKGGAGGLPSGRKKADPSGRVSKISDAEICNISGKVVQAEAMLLGPLATDPMRAYFIRSARG